MKKLLLVLFLFTLVGCSSQGDQEIFEEGYQSGKEIGYKNGIIDGEVSGYNKGETDGYNKGFDEGIKNCPEKLVTEDDCDIYFKDWYAEGYEDGQWAAEQ